MRLAYVCADPGIPVFGSKGCSIHVQEFLKALVALGIETTLIASRIEHPRPIDLAGIQVVHSPLAKSPDQAHREQHALEANDTFISLLDEHGPFDIVYERYSLWSYAGMSAARRMGVPGILEVNAPLIVEQTLHRGLVNVEAAERVFRRTLADATSIVTVSRAVAEYVKDFGGSSGKISVHPNGVDLRRFRPDVPASSAVPEAFTVGFVGSLKPWHGLEVLADAFESVRRAVPHARLLVVGDGPVRADLESRLERSGVLESCTFTGKVSPAEVPGYVASMDVAVVPSLPPPPAGDYFSPLKLFEYMAMQLPVVCSRSGQMAAVVQNGVNGLLFTPGSSMELAASLIALSGDKSRRNQLGRAARQTIERDHGWTTVVQRVLQTADLGCPKTGVA